ncbi:MAG: nitrogen fixation protein NifQ [Thiotrichaceae bacterium]|nr:nitrogen fixation protein NifQ [Thiotrichaceae bacterium]
MNAPLNPSEFIYNELIQASKSSLNDVMLARMLSTWYSGHSTLPLYLGLSAETYTAMLAAHFPSIKLPEPSPELAAKTLDLSRMLEVDELRTLLLRYRAGYSIDEEWLSDILIAGCLADLHLWHNLGLWARADLTQLLEHNFPKLAAINTQGMKWKKFLYKQLCLEEGIYVCRAPSCEVCEEYKNCFGSEED